MVFHAEGDRKEDIRVSGEHISEVGLNLTPKEDEILIDADGKWIFPGIVDPHTHMGVPIKNLWSADNFDTGTRSALNGGVTTIIDFTVLEDGQTLHDSISERKRRASLSHCDYGLHCNFTKYSTELLSEISGIIQDGIISFKVFTTYREAGMMLSYYEIESVAKTIGENKGILMVHAEDDKEISEAINSIPEQKRLDPYSHGLSRPDTSEEKAILEMAAIAERTSCSVYIVHLNSAKGFKAALSSDKILIETCPHYLLLDDSFYRKENGRMFVASPPLRKPQDSNTLWSGIIQKQIQTIGTDHCPFCMAQKQTDIPFDQIPNGMGGVETLFPVLLAQWVKRELPKPLLTNLVSTQPANIFGLKGKGAIKPGMDGDIVIVDPSCYTKDWESRLVSITDWNAYAGLPALFPEHVFLRGTHVVKNGELQSPPIGKFIPGNI